MKLKVKLPLLFSVIVLLLACIIFYYIKVEVINSIVTKVFETRQYDIKRDEIIPDRIGQLYPNISSIKKYMKKKANQEKLSITLYDKNFTSVIDVDAAHQGEKYGGTFYPIRDRSGETVMFLKIERPYNVNVLVLNMFLTKTLALLMISLILVFITLTIFFHFNITKPIQNLNKRLRMIKNYSPFSFIQLKRKDEIGELYQHVNEMQKRIQQSNKEQVDMVAAITHDLKTPLTSINGFIELLLANKPLSEKNQKEYLHLIKKKSQDITTLINEFSAFTKNEILLPSVNFQLVNIKQFFENIALEYEAELSGLDYELIWEHSFHQKDSFMINESIMRRVFANLFSNSVRYGPTENLKIYLKGYLKKDFVYFVLEDNGIGVPEDDIGSLFQRFFTVDKSRQSIKGGTGLGLASCKSIIERHGGEIIAFRSIKGGLGIKFSVPINKIM